MPARFVLLREQSEVNTSDHVVTGGNVHFGFRGQAGPFEVSAHVGAIGLTLEPWAVHALHVVSLSLQFEP